MSNKCEWKDGMFSPCEEIESFHNAGVFLGKYGKMSIHTEFCPDFSIDFCPFCGADIRKPEPEVIIKKSGGTWVINCHGDRICINPERYCDDDYNKMDISDELMHHPDWWPKISEITIDDNLALLRPMGVFSYEVEHCIWKEETPRILIYAKYDGDSYEFFDDNGRPYVVCRLATVSDL